VRDKLTTVLKVVVSLGLIAFAFSRVDFPKVAAQLARANPVYFTLALLVYMLAIVINGAKWQVLMRAQGVVVPFGAVLRFIFAGFFFNNFLPAQVGGDLVRGFSLARYTDRGADAAVSVIVDRVVGLMAYMATAAFAAFIAVNVTGHSELQQVEWVAVLALVVLAAGFALLLSRRLRDLITRIFQVRLFRPLAPLWGRLSNAFGAYRFQYRALAVAFAIGLAGIACTTLVNWILSQSMGGGMTITAIALFNPLIALVGMLPISIGGIGVNQTAYPFFYGLAGVPVAHALAVSILMQAIMFLGSLPGGVLWLVGKREQRTAPEQQPQ
jgi:glycosyltransferase 2 family protein